MSHGRILQHSLPVALLVLALSGTAAAAPAPRPADGPAPAAEPPRVKIENTDMDLGEVPPGGKADATFVVHNVGGEVLRILSVKPG